MSLSAHFAQRNTCNHMKLRFSSSSGRHCCHGTSNHSRQHTCSSSARDPGYTAADPQGPDLVSNMLNSCLSATAHITDAVVTRLADALHTVAPPEAPRSKVEASVKGALVLLLLGLLKGVISFVLLVGCIALAVYTATQVFGWHGFLLQQADSSFGGGNYGQQQYPPRQPPPGQAYPQGYNSQAAYRQPQAQQQQYGQYRQPGRQQQGTRPPPGDQGDVVDVFHYPRAAPQ